MNQPRTEIALPISSDDLRLWAANIAEANPIGRADGDATVELEVDDLHSGVELTLALEDRPIHTIILYGFPNEAEQQAEEDWALEAAIARSLRAVHDEGAS